jgi:hypothetical protein
VSPDPVPRHAEAFCDLINGEQPGHTRQADEGTVPANVLLADLLLLAVASSERRVDHVQFPRAACVVRVDLRGLEVCVAEELLERAQWHPGSRELGRERVAKVVEADLRHASARVMPSFSPRVRALPMRWFTRRPSGVVQRP